MAENVTRIRDHDTRERVTVLETQMLAVATNVEKLEQKVEGQYQTLHSRISDMRDDLRDEIDKKHTAMTTMLKEHMESETQHHESIRDKISAIEKWRWMMVGASVIVGYIIAHIRLDKIF